LFVTASRGGVIMFSTIGMRRHAPPMERKAIVRYPTGRRKQHASSLIDFKERMRIILLQSNDELKGTWRR